jgi:hypothetical protein
MFCTVFFIQCYLNNVSAKLRVSADSNEGSRGFCLQPPYIPLLQVYNKKKENAYA